MENEIIKFETAKLAHEKGFNHMKANIYGDNLHYGRDEPEGEATAKQGNVVIGTYLAPTQALLQRWLRETHGLYVLSIPYEDEMDKRNRQTLWTDEVIDSKEKPWLREITTYTYYHSYEEALEAGLIEALKFIEL